MKHLYRTVLAVLLGAGFACAQTGMQSPPTTPPTFPSQQQPPVMPPPTVDENTGHTGAASTTALPKAQADIQTALRRQMPASADSVTVSVTDDNRLQLTGTVTSETEKGQIEQVARSAAPDQNIVNNLKVANAPVTPSSTMPPASTVPPTNPDGKTGTEGRDVNIQPRQPMPPMGSSFMGQQGYPSATPNPGGQQYPGASPNPGMSGQNTQESTPVNTAEAQSNIQKALQQDKSLSNANIAVTVNKNKVELTGMVASKDQKKTAKQIAESNAGGMKVVDHLKVEGAKDNSTPQKY